jgi:amino acid adenylation domain-containing protein
MSLNEESTRQSDDRPLSGAQAGLWYAGRLVSHSAAYNTGEAVEVHGALDLDVFEAALRRTVGEADTFALRFVDTDDGPRCHRAPDADDWNLHRVDVSGEKDPHAAAWAWIDADLATPVDLEKGPLFAHALLTLAPDHHIWLLRAHHILLDGYSYKLVGRRLADIYNALVAGKEPVPSTFAPVSRLQGEESAYLSSERCARDRDHWVRRLAGLPEPARLTRRAAPPAARFVRRLAELEGEEAEVLSAAAARLEVTRTDLLTAAVVVYLHRMTGADDLLLGMATMSRFGSAALRTPGTASDVLPLRVTATPDTHLGAVVRAVADELEALRRHHQYRGEFIRRDLNLVGSGRRLYGPVLNMVPFTESIDFGGHPVTWHHLAGGAVEDLQISVRPGTTSGGLWLAFDANPARYEEDELTLHRDRFLTLLRRLADAAPDTALADLDLLLPGEHPREAPVRDFPVTGTLTGLFEERAASVPERTAVTCGDEHLTYAELNIEANRLARLLAERGAGPGRVVALALDGGSRLLPTLLAVLKTGAACLPLDPGHPAERLRPIVEGTAPVVLVTRRAHAHLAERAPAATTVLLDDPEVTADLADRSGDDLTDADRHGPTSPADTAYVIHAPGSTGRPEGVPVTHANVVRLFAAAAEHFGFGADDVWTLSDSRALDFSLWETWGALLHGGRIVVVPDAVSRSPRDFLELLHREGVTVLSQTPSAFEQLIHADLERNGDTGALRHVVLGGEALDPARLRPWAERHGLDRPALVHMYGFPETTGFVTHHRITSLDPAEPHEGSVIGSPLADLRVHLLDPGGRPVPPGATGEMYVSGAGVTAGYLNRPAPSAERFPDDPFGPPGARMYRTGDLARRRCDGTLELLGRAGRPGRSSGPRCDLHEIEAALTAHPGVVRAAVVQRDGDDGSQQLVAYTVPAGDGPASPADLRAHAAAHLPGHLVPAAWVSVDALPLTADGDLDTAVLPSPEAAPAASRTRPETPQQALVCRLFEEVLQLPQNTVGIDADFFDLGGDSLLAARLLARLRQESGVKVSLTTLFEKPTVAVVARLLAELSDTTSARPVLGLLDRPARVPLSFAQERMWFLNRLDDSAATYNIPVEVPLGPDVDSEALRAALGDLTDRHESLRTVLAEQDGRLHQRILPPGALRPRWHRVDCPADEIAAQVTAARRHRFDLTAESPLAAYLFGPEEERTLLLVLHHSAADGWSMRPFADDLSTAYAARRAGRAPRWAPPPVQYADYALWQRALLAPEPAGPGRLERLTGHWRTALDGLPEECTLPGDRPRPPVPRGAGAHVTVPVDPGLHRDLLRLADRENTSLFMVLHAAVSALLTRCGAGEDIVLGTPVAGRTEPGLDDVIGLITNTLVLRADTSGDPAFRDLLARLRTADLAALDHQDLPFDRLVEELNPPRKAGRHPLFQVMLALQNNEPAVLELDGQRAELRPTATGTAKFDLFVDVFQRQRGEGAPDGLDLHVEYATDLYDAGTAEAFARALHDVLRTVCAEPGCRVGELPAPPERTPAPAAADAAELEEVALSVSGIRDARALPGADGGACLYVAAGRADAVERVEEAMDRAGHGRVRVTAVNALPLDEHGALDTESLRVLPAVDRIAADAWQRDLTGIPGVTTVEVSVQEVPEELGRRHAGLPDRTPQAASAGTGSAAETSAVPALSEGPALAEPSVSGWAQALRRAAELDRGDIVHVHPDGRENRRGYASLIAEASRVLAGLRRAGLRPGDQVVLQCDVSEDFLAVLWGCVLGGFVAVPLTVPASYDTPSAALTKLEGIWRMLGRPWIVCSAGRETGLREVAARQDWPGLRLTTADALREAPEDHDWHAARPDDLILMLMTSGSTGLPKAVRLTHRNVLTRSAATEQMNGLDATDVSLNWIPLDHVTGVVMFHLRDVYLGCRQIHAPTTWILQDPLRWMDLADRHRVTVTWAPNFAFGLLAEESHRFADRAWDLSPMRLVMNAGEVVVASAARRFLHTLEPFGLPQDVMHPGWGMSETCSVVTDAVLPGEPVENEGTFVSCGRPYPGFAMRIVDEQGNVLTEGEAGRFQVRGTSVTGGYHDNPGANAEAFTDDGWFDTGDLAFLREGELYITGRAKDVIIVNGVNHYSHEIEACVEELPHVERSFTAAVAVRSDPSSPTDELALFFHLTPETTAQDTAGALREIAGKVTREIGVSPAFLIPVEPDAVPKTEIGKIQRTKLRKNFEAGAFDDEVRRAQVLLGTAATVPDWFLRPVWQRVRRPDAPAASAGRHTLVLTGGDPWTRRLADRLADALRSGGGLCTVVTEGPSYARIDAARYRVRPAAEADHRELLRRSERDRRPVDAVLHLDGPHGTGTPEKAPYDEDAMGRLLALVRALAARPGPQRPVDLLHVTMGAQAVHPGEHPVPVHAMAGAVLKSLREEFGWLRAAHLDLAADAGEDPLPVLAAEATVAADGAEVAYRGGHRYERRLAPLPDTPSRVQAPERDGFTLITGGLGGVGSEVAAHLLRTPGTRLLILGRTPHAELESTADQSGRAEALRRLRELGEVRYARADVTDERQVRAALDTATEAWGVPLVSVLHLAGTLVESPVGDLDTDAWSQALEAKVRGAWVLHRVCADHPVASFTMFSSVNGYFGGAMNAAYAAANAYLDALALHRRSLGLPAQSLAWSMWREHGMSRGYRLTALTEARGYRLLDAPAALRSFDLARTLDEPHLLIGADRTAPWVRSHVVAPVRQLRRLTARVGLEDGADLGALHHAAADSARRAGVADHWVLRSAGTARHRGRTADGGEDVRRLENRLAEVWCGVLGRDQVGRTDNFFDLGGNSLLLVTAQSAVNSAFGTDLSVVDLFAHPTVRDLARHLATRTDPRSTAVVAEGDPAAPLSTAQGGPSDLDRAREQAQRQRAARARRSARHGRNRGHG